MASKLVVLVAALAVCSASPVWITGYEPGMMIRWGRSPNLAFGFGSGFSSNIGGISHSSGIGASFQSGNAQAYGEGIGAGGNFARGVGIAHAAPSYQLVYPQPIPYGSAISSAQNFGGNFGSAVSAAQSQNGIQSAVSSAQNIGGYGYESAVSSANSNAGFGSATSAAQNVGGNYGSAVSSAQNNGASNYGAAVSAAQNIGGYRASTAHTVQQRGSSLQHSGASSVNGPGVQAAQSHAVNTGYY